MNLKLLALPALLSAVACLIVWYGGWSLWELTALWEKGVENTQWQTLLIGLSALFTALIMLPSAYITTRAKNRQPQPEAIIQRRPQQNTDPTETETEEDIEDEEEDYIKTQPQQKVKLKSKSDIRLQRQQEAINKILQINPPTINPQKLTYEEAQQQIQKILDPPTPTLNTPDTTETETEDNISIDLKKIEDQTSKELNIAIRRNLIRLLDSDKVLVFPTDKNIKKYGLETFNIKIVKNNGHDKPQTQTTPDNPDEVTPEDLMRDL